MAVLSRTLRVRGFKVGPDFIDPGYHRLATGSLSINLDAWLAGERGAAEDLSYYSKGYDLSIVEGVMGFYDGLAGAYSTFAMSQLTATPVILVISCRDISSTACASSLRGMKALGYVRRNAALALPSRHLGLVTVEDNPEAMEALKRASEEVERGVDMGSVLSIAESAPPMERAARAQGKVEKRGIAAVAKDKAFGFYYQQTLDALSQEYELKEFSPTEDQAVEGASLIYLGGGYPELHVEELEGSENTKRWLRDSVSDGKAVIGECGGMMYLSRYIEHGGKRYDMAGIFQVGIKSMGRLTIGYTELSVEEDNPIASSGSTIRGHEFHTSYADWVGEEERLVMRNLRGKGLVGGRDGLLRQRAIGTYSHFMIRSALQP